MNTRHLIIFGMAATVTMVVQGELLDGGWRISVGASYNAPAKVRLNFSPARFNGGNVLPTASGVTLEQARRQAGGRTVNGKTYYDYDGSGRHISSVSAVDQHTDAVGGGDGSPEAGTWNAHVYKGNTTIQDDSFTLASVEYGYVEQHDDGGRLKLRDTDEAATPGVLVELSRNLYHNKDYNFGVDLAFAVNFFFGRDIFKTSSRAYQNAGVEVGAGADAANLKKAFGLAGAATLDLAKFDEKNVVIEFGEPVDGKLRFTATAADAKANSFFMRMRVK